MSMLLHIGASAVSLDCCVHLQHYTGGEDLSSLDSHQYALMST